MTHNDKAYATESDNVQSKEIRIPPELLTELTELDHIIFCQVSELSNGPEYPEFYRLPPETRAALRALSVSNVQQREKALTGHGHTEALKRSSAKNLHFATSIVHAFRKITERISGAVGPQAPRTEPSYEAAELKAFVDYELSRQDFGHDAKWPEYDELPTQLRDRLIAKAAAQLTEHHNFLTGLLDR